MMTMPEMPPADEARYWSDALYKRDVDRANAWARISQQMDALAYRMQVRAWLDGSALGDSDSRDRYTVTARSLGHLTITLTDGSTRDMEAPVPLA